MAGSGSSGAPAGRVNDPEGRAGGVARNDAPEAEAATPEAPRSPANVPQRTNARVRAALVATVLLTLVSLAFLVWPVLETQYSGDPEEMRMFDMTIRVASASVPESGKLMIAFGMVLVALLTLLISEEIDGRVWNFVAYSSLASAASAVFLYIYTEPQFYENRFGAFPYVSDFLQPWRDYTSYPEKKMEMFVSFRSWIYLGGIWNIFVFISMIKNKVATEFIENTIGIKL